VINYSRGAALWTDFFAAYWGFRSFKAGSLGCKPLVDDMFCNSDYDSGDGCKTKPTTMPAVYAGYPVTGTPTYNAFTGYPETVSKYLNWDDNATGAANRADADYNESGTGTAEIKQVSQFTDGIVATENILGVSFTAVYRVTAGSNGACSHLIRADGADVTQDIANLSATYDNDGYFRAKTPAGNAWTIALVNSMEYGLVRGAGASDMRNLRGDSIFVEVATGTLEAEAPPAYRRRGVRVI
jgi:hypothetical protein